MRNIYVIGTVHNMLPKHKEELNSILEDINPDQILIEILKKDLKSRKIRKYPKEMVYAYRWGIRHKKKVNGFDSPIEIEKKSVTKRELKEFDRIMLKIIGKYNWKKLNKPKYDKIGDKAINQVIDRKKLGLRQKQMLENIRKMMAKDGIILILTGAYHLRFFEKKIRGAVFTLRK